MGRGAIVYSQNEGAWKAVADELLDEFLQDDAVAIDEALNLARELSTDDSAGYIHGVLGRISNIKESLAI